MPGIFSAFPIYYREISYSTEAALAFGGADSIDENSLLVDTGANFSIVKDYGLMSELKSCPPVTFDELQGALTVSQSGSLLGICQSYNHPDAVANIISFSQVKDLGFEIAYNDTDDEFILSFDTGICSFIRRSNGLFICHTVTTVSHNEAQFNTREVKEARVA